jgi:hypothetical protein
VEKGLFPSGPKLAARHYMGNPVEGERDSVLKLNTIPL